MLKYIAKLLNRVLGALLGILMGVLMIPAIALYPIYAYLKKIQENNDWGFGLFKAMVPGLLMMGLSYIPGSFTLVISALSSLAGGFYSGTSKGIKGALAFPLFYFRKLVPSRDTPVNQRYSARMRYFFSSPILILQTRMKIEASLEIEFFPQDLQAQANNVDDEEPQAQPNPQPAAVQPVADPQTIFIKRIMQLCQTEEKKKLNLLTAEEINVYAEIINSIMYTPQRNSLEEKFQEYKKLFEERDAFQDQDSTLGVIKCPISLDYPKIPITIVTKDTKSNPHHTMLDRDVLLKSVKEKGPIDPTGRGLPIEEVYLGYPKPFTDYIAKVRSDIAAYKKRKQRDHFIEQHPYLPKFAGTIASFFINRPSEAKAHSSSSSSSSSSPKALP